ANDTLLVADSAQATGLKWVSPATAIGHAILDGSLHTDTTSDIPDAGSLIVGTSGRLWDELVISAPSAGSRNVLGIDNGETTPSWRGNDLLVDADGDTKVQMEESADEDVIRFDAAGTELMTIGHDGAVDIFHTAVAPGEHGLELIVDAAGQGNIHALDIVLTTGAIGAGDDEEAILVNIDESAAGGGNVVALEVLATEGSADVHAVEAGVLVGPMLQFSGTFMDMDVALVKAVDRLTEFTTAGNNIVFFVADNDTITIGDAAQFFEMEFLLATVASKDVKPTFEYSKAGGLWEPFSPADGTNGMQNTGVVAWEADDVVSPAWVVHSGNYRIRITRTRGGSITSPIEDKVQIADVIVYEWDESGNLNINTLIVDGNVGIGTTTPQELLHVGAGIDGSDISATDLLVTRAGPSNLSVRDSTNDVETFLFASSVGGIMGTITDDPLDIRTNNISAIFIDAFQKVGIGEVAPDSKLEVNGTLHITGNSSFDGLLAVDIINERTAVAGVELEGAVIRDGLIWGQTLHPELGIGDQIELTLSGNEITDKTRALALEGDGRVFPDSSFGIWEPTTNLVTNGGIETNTTGFVVSGDAALSRITSQFKFGSASLEVVANGSTANEGVYHAFAASAGTEYTVSVWVRGTGGGTIHVALWDNVSGFQVGSTHTLTTEWTRLSVTATTGGGSTTFRLYIKTNTAQGITWQADGFQSEAPANATPYVETDGGTVSRGIDRVQAPAPDAELGETQGWVAVRCRPSRSSANPSDAPANNRLFEWGSFASDWIGVYWASNGRWTIGRHIAGGGTLGVLDTFSAEDEITIIATWTATDIALSVKGAAFSSTGNTDIPTIPDSTFDIGSDGTASNPFNGDVLWLAVGKGTLTDADARLINACGNTAPNRSVLPTVSQPTFLWDANTGAAGPDILLQDPDVFYVDYLNAKLGFFGVTAIVQPGAYTQTYATADKTHANPTATAVGDLVATNGGWGYSSEANADKVHDAIDKLVADVADVKQVINAVIDDLQALGLAQ
ncbi:hypothetical protein LCGC14_0814150, partial [marine sediment metagenome]